MNEGVGDQLSVAGWSVITVYRLLTTFSPLRDSDNKSDLLQTPGKQ
jgi:hypothetical protein